MAFDEELGRRIAGLLSSDGIDFTEKKMFGGLAFMINDKMCAGVIKNDMMVRVLDEKFADVLKLPNARQMDFTGRPMKGFVYVDHSGLKDSELRKWLAYGIEFGKYGVVKSKKKTG